MQVSSEAIPQAKTIAQSLMFWFWFSMQARILLGFLLFYSHLSYAILLDGVMTLGFASVALVLLVTTDIRPNKFEWPFTARLLLAFLLWSGITLFWTRADSHFIAFAYWAEWGLQLLVVFILLKIGDIHALGDTCLKGFTLGTALLALAIELLHPQAEVRGGLGDIQLHPNFVGNFLAMASLFSLHFALQREENPSRRVAWGFLSLFLFLVLLQTLAKTMIAGFILAILLYVGGPRFSCRRKMLLICFMGVVLLIFTWASWKYFEGYVYNEDNETLTLTSRTVLWIKSWDMIEERPMLGYGILSFRDYGPQIAEFRLVHAHNEWVMLWFQTGLVGVVLAAAIYLTFFVRMRRIVKNNASWLPGRLGRALLFYMLLRGITDASLLDLIFPLPLMLTLLPWATARFAQARAAKSAKIIYSRPSITPHFDGAPG
jgi:O-antigen ligase